MKTFAILFALCAVAVSARDFSTVRPIEDLLLQFPNEYPLVAKLYNGRRSSGRIVGGDEATPGQFPYQVALMIESSQGTFFCGGSLLNKDTVMTAAHCTDQAKSVEVVLGAHNVRENEAEQLRLVVTKDNIKIHEKWSRLTLTNDISLLKLPSSVTPNKRISMIDLPRRKDRDNTFVQEKCTTSGWGKDKDSSSSISPVLRFVDTEIITNSVCSRYYFGVIKSSHICASGKGGKSSCNGDSGGPLVIEHNGKTTQIGVVSFGIAFGCERGFPHAYTRVTEYLDWIAANSNVQIQD